MHFLDIEDLFQQLLCYRERSMNLNGLGPWLQHRLQGATFPDLDHLPFVAHAYTRTCVARENRRSQPDFEALLMRWDRQAKTTIHGHPEFSFYTVISGLFKMEFFSGFGCDGLEAQGTQLFYPGDVTWHLGQQGRCDNFIHRVTCLEPGCTFHIYSDNAQQGIVYEPTKVTIFSNR